MLPEASSCTPRSQDVSEDAGSSSGPASQGPNQWEALRTKDFKRFLYNWARLVCLTAERQVTAKEKPWVIAEHDVDEVAYWQQWL
eukprot:9452833-Prorocentrum_lima.AAC.1